MYPKGQGSPPTPPGALRMLSSHRRLYQPAGCTPKTENITIGAFWTDCQVNCISFLRHRRVGHRKAGNGLHHVCSLLLWLAVSMTASSRSNFCCVGQFSDFSRWFTAAAWTSDTRRANSSFPSLVLGKYTIRLIEAIFRITVTSFDFVLTSLVNSAYFMTMGRKPDSGGIAAFCES